MVIDPFIVVARTDSHKNAETRRDMQPLVELAREFDVAVLGVTHFSKGTQKQTLIERVTGSIAFAAQARAVSLRSSTATRVVIAGHPAEPDASKSNFGPTDGGYGYDIAVTLFPVGDERIECTEINGATASKVAPRTLSMLPKVAQMSVARQGWPLRCSWLKHWRTDHGGPRTSKWRRLKEGISLKTLKRAKKDADVASYQSGGSWWWSLPGGGVI